MFNTLALRKFFLLISNILLLYAALFLTLLFRFGKNFTSAVFAEHFPPFTILYAVWLIVFYAFGFYELGIFKKSRSFYVRTVASLLINLALGMIFFYLFPSFGIAPKTNLFLDILIFGVLFVIWRKVVFSLFSSRFLNKIAVLGKTPEAETLVKEIENNVYLGYKFVGFLEPESNISAAIEKEKIDTLVLATDLQGRPRLIQNLYQCLPSRINLMDLSRAYEIIFEKIPISYLTQIWFLENLKERRKSMYDKVKRGMDVVLTFIILLITLIFWPLIALAIKLDSRGPVFYRQERIGKDKKPFWLIKFRSMVVQAEKDGPKWATEKDERATKVGNFLRKTHLDEIPQMLNVLKGDISLVGPRPERPEFVSQIEKEVPHYHLRYLIKPGFTGWAQIKFRYGRSIMDSQEKFQYDLYYIKNRSLFLDLSVLLKTFQLFFKKE